MMFLASALFGKLSFSEFNNGLITTGAAVSMVLGVVAVIAFITYKKRWRWLYKEWLTTVDPKKIGVMYIIVAILMLIRAGVDALMIRAQQATSVGSSNGFLSSNTFQQVFSAHGTIMIFFVAMGLMFGLINLIVPLQIGSRDVAFPRLNATSFWLFVSGMVLVNLSLVVGQFSAAGWLAYPPLSELRYSPGVGVDYWIWSLQVAGAGSLLAGINFVVTILKMRCKGMNLMKMPMFCWSVLGSMSLVIFAFPILTATLAMLFLDRSMGMHFFTADGGGNPMMYVNLIWAWGHPEVYILILPAFGVYSEIVATFAKKRLFGYKSMVAAIWAIVILSFSVWLHHFFTMGAGADVNGFFGIMTMVIAVPTGVKIFNWLFTLFRGRISYKTPMYWFFGFIVTFTVGGVAGVLMGIPPLDFQLHNSLFLVAHFHTMIIGGVVFGYLAALTYWFPKIFGYRLNERLGKYVFWCWLVGYALAFIPLYILGLMGATRRIDHYSSSLGWQPLFIVAGIGASIIALGVAFMILQHVVSFFQRNDNLDLTGDPWDGRTLEWMTASPVQPYNFAIIPEVRDRDAFWSLKQATKVNPTKSVSLKYSDIIMPKNTPMGLFIAGFGFALSFGLIWHIVWLCLAAFICLIAAIIYFATEEETEYVITAQEVEKTEEKARKKGVPAWQAT